jgi:hypothetical protein
MPDRPLGVLLLAIATALVLVASAGRATAYADDDENYKVVQGLGMYFGILPAGIIRGRSGAAMHGGGSPEATMHGGVPSGSHEYHIIIAVFDDATRSRIENAKVTATVSGLGHLGRQLSASNR